MNLYDFGWQMQSKIVRVQVEIRDACMYNMS